MPAFFSLAQAIHATALARALHSIGPGVTVMAVSGKFLPIVVVAALCQASEFEEKAWSVLDGGLSSKDAVKRRQALASMGILGQVPKAVGKVEAALEERDSPTVRQTAAAVLGLMKSASSIPKLKLALDSPDSEVSFTAATSLWEMGDQSGREIFQDVITGERSDGPGMLREKMREAKRKIRNPASLALMGVKEASGALLGPFSLGIGLAEEALKDGDASGKTLSIEKLTDDKNPYALALIVWALEDKNAMVRAAAAKALAIRGDTGVLPKLWPLLFDGKEPVSYTAAAAIIRLSSAGASRAD